MTEWLPYITAGSVLLLSGILLGVFLWIFRRGGRATGRDLQGDLANMMILFQTMRDMLEQQKELARQLNASIDRKVELIRNVVKAAASAHDELCQAQQTLAQQLEHAKAQLDLLPRFNAAPSGETASQPSAGTPAPDWDPSYTPPPRVPESSEAEALQPAAPPEEESDFVDNWVGLAVADPIEDEGPTPDRSVDIAESFFLEPSPEETRAARDAFRMLLNMASTDEPAAPPKAKEAAGNGHSDALQTNRALIYEYSDAGMGVSDIARELGMGKGEVRLILSLRKQEERA